ncbi:isochorismatase family protein [Kineococcus sp. TBRC 1896]|uniref:Isochorismatase family protein n=1 Tax=Kineococcus mangrovi TaxID=1660183 RepID=A0ABV4I486_9ACTN
MTTLTDRPGSVLLVVDVQRGVMAASVDSERVVATIAVLVQRARAAGVPVVWVQHSSDDLPLGSEAWRYVPELVAAAGEAVVHKTYGDSFEDTDLEDVLAARGAGRLVVAGAQSDACIRSTLHGAFTRGYDVTLVTDAHTTEDLSAWGAPPPQQVVAHTNLYWGFQRAPGRTAAAVPSDEVDLAGTRD